MQAIDKRQIFQVLVGLAATIGFFSAIDYQLTSSALIANFIILILSPTRQSATVNVKGQIYAQIIGISLGIILAFTVTNIYLGVTIILLLVLTLPLWLKVWVPALPLAIAAYVIFQAETLADATFERILIKAMSLIIALVVAWAFAQRYTKRKAMQSVYHQFLQLSQLLHEFMWRTPSEIAEVAFPVIEVLPEVVTQLLNQEEQEFVLLNEKLLELQFELRISQESLPLSVQEELQYALRMHHDYFQVIVAKHERHKLFLYQLPEKFISSTWNTSKLLAVVLSYLQQLQEVARHHTAIMQTSAVQSELEEADVPDYQTQD